MPHQVVAGEVYVFSMVCKYKDQESVNSIKVSIGAVAGFGGVYDTEVLADLDGAWNGFFKSYLPVTNGRYMGSLLRQYTFTGPRVRTKYITTNAGAGLAAEPAIPKQTAGLVSMYTDLMGKKQQGRMYWPFVSLDGMDPATGDPLPAFVGSPLGDVVTEVTGVRIVTSGAATASVLYGVRPTGDTFHQFTSAFAHDKWATQRRRSDYAARNRSHFD